MRNDYTDEQARDHLQQAVDDNVREYPCAVNVQRLLDAGCGRDDIWFRSRCEGPCDPCPVWQAILDVVEEE